MSSNRVIGILKKFINTLAILIIAGIAGFALLLGAFMIPGQYAQENVGKSINTIKEQGRYPNLVPWTFSMLVHIRIRLCFYLLCMRETRDFRIKH